MNIVLTILRWIMVVIGILMILLGGLWILQGVNILPGSFMSGQSFWAIVGTGVFLVGILLSYLGLRSRPARPVV
ncbi:MAG: hypothetical protein NT075_14940 [Chloroflexi bacterium]|nr:hypothetical protein [Chloroflexota bacterium]